MEIAQYPAKRCGEAVWTIQGMAYPCEVVYLHPGPHANFSSPDSVRARDAWEDAHPDWREGVGSMDIIVGEDQT